MDNKAYLDQIAVKETKKSSSSLFSPALIKVIIGALFLIIILIAMITIFKGQNKTSYDSYAELYFRYTNLLAEDSPMLLQKEKIHSSALRANTASFISLARSFSDTYVSATTGAGIDIYTLSPERWAVLDEEFASFGENLEDAYMNGYIDQAYASECAYQIAILIQLENDIIENSDNESLSQSLYNNLNNLKAFQEVYEKYGTE